MMPLEERLRDLLDPTIGYTKSYTGATSGPKCYPGGQCARCALTADLVQALRIPICRA